MDKVFFIIQFPAFVLAEIIDRPICLMFFNDKLENSSYYSCKFYESPIFNYFFIAWLIVEILVVILIIYLVVKKTRVYTQKK